MNRIVDPAHVFYSVDRSLVAVEAMERELDATRARVAELERHVVALNRKNRTLEAVLESPIVH